MMHEVFTRTLRRRGLYTGSYKTDVVGGIPMPRPPFFVIVNRRGSGMVRVEIGIGRRSFWADWGDHDVDTD